MAHSLRFSEHIGRNAAHDLVYGACRKTVENETSLIGQLRQLLDVTRHLDNKVLEALVDPANYLGSSSKMIDRVLDRNGGEREGRVASGSPCKRAGNF